jgi:hypothetical protein
VTGGSEVRLAFAAMVETLDRLDVVSAAVDALPLLDVPVNVGAPGLQASLDGLADRCERMQQRTAVDVATLRNALDQIIFAFSSTDEGLAQLVAGSRRQIRSTPGSGR